MAASTMTVAEALARWRSTSAVTRSQISTRSRSAGLVATSSVAAAEELPTAAAAGLRVDRDAGRRQRFEVAAGGRHRHFASIVDPFDNVLGVMFNQHYLDVLTRN